MAARQLGLLFAGLVLALVLAEISLRVIGFGQVTPEMSFGINTRAALEKGTFEPHPDLFWTLPVRARPYDEAIAAVHPDRTVLPKGPRHRVIVLGDSCSRLAVSGMPYSVFLQDRLGPDRTEVLNASVPGYSSYQGLVWSRLQLFDLLPDVLVVWFGWNDHWRATGITDREYAVRISPARLRLMALFDRRRSLPPLRVPLADYRENLQAILAEAQDRGVEVLLVAAPQELTPEARGHLVRNRSIIPADDPVQLHEEYLEVVRSFAGTPGVGVFAADRMFRALRAKEPLLHRDGIHPTDIAHRVLGAALATAIRDGSGADGGIPLELLELAQAVLDEADD